jgi:Flp pilus assembly protein TadD
VTVGVLTAAGDQLYPVVLNNYAFALAGQGRYSEALPVARKALELEKTQGSMYHTLATILHGLRQVEAAEVAARTAVEMKPASEHLLLLAEIRLARGDKREATTLAVRCLQAPGGKKEKDLARDVLKRIRDASPERNQP